jgi:hypothetical protein
MFIVRRNRSNFNNPFVQKYLNSVYDMRGQALRCYTGGDFNYKYDRDQINASLPCYTIYKIKDGTRVSLWWKPDGSSSDNGGQWIISTRKLIFANDVVWRSGKTYWDIFKDVLGAYSKLNLDELDRSRCYNFVMRHPTQHPFTTGSNMPAKELSIISIYSMADERSPVSHPVADFMAKYGLSDQPLYQERVTSIQGLEEACTDSIATYTRRRTPLFGFILRSNDFSQTKRYSNVMIYSSLFRLIRNIFYDKRLLASYVNTEEYALYNNIKVRILITVITNDSSKISLFGSLFPEYIKFIKNVQSVINHIVDRTAAHFIDETTKMKAGSQFIYDYMIKSGLEASKTDLAFSVSFIREQVMKSTTVVQYLIKLFDEVLIKSAAERKAIANSS